jgi:Transposase, Mutator family
VSRVLSKVKSDWDAWNARSLAEEPIVRLILDGTVVRVRLDRKTTSISLLVVLGVCEDGQKVLLAIKSMGGESSEAWRTVLDDLINRGLQTSSSSSTARRDSTRGLPACGTACRSSGARSIMPTAGLCRSDETNPVDPGVSAVIMRHNPEFPYWACGRAHQNLPHAQQRCRAYHSERATEL